jgi:adenosylcobyric acid synthase
MATAVERHAAAGGLLLGICGGCQMLGKQILDPEGVESSRPQNEGLGLLGLDTHFVREKTTASVVARALVTTFLAPAGAAELSAYEIHMGQVVARAGVASPFGIDTRNGGAYGGGDGAVNAAGNVVGTLLHGILENDRVRAHLIASLWQRRGVDRPAFPAPIASVEDEYDRLEASVRASLDLGLLRRLARV